VIDTEGPAVTPPPQDWPAPLPWQRDALRDALAGRARWPHALLLTGAPGLGKRTLALELARALVCEAPGADGAACGSCDGCRYAAAGQHPDLRLVEPVEIDDDGVATPIEWIKVESIRAMIEWVQLTSHRRGAKVAVIVPAERMRVEAANALLKTLEEPPAGSYLILVSHQPGRLPATVRSRCGHLVAPSPDVSTAHAWLAAQGVAAPAPLLAQARGAPLAALALAAAGYQDERAHWLRALAAPGTLEAATLAARIDDAPREARKDRLAAAIDWMLDWSVDLARLRAGGVARVNPDWSAQLAALAPKVAPLPLFRYHRELTRQRALLAHPLTPRLVAEALLLQYLTLFLADDG
jgi:DNA polymerase-3 subunit delta'